MHSNFFYLLFIHIPKNHIIKGCLQTTFSEGYYVLTGFSGYCELQAMLQNVARRDENFALKTRANINKTDREHSATILKCYVDELIARRDFQYLMIDK